MAHAETKQKQISYCQAPLSPRVKKGGKTVVSKALIKKGASNLTPKIHVKRGDMVMLMEGSKKVGKGKTGKVLTVLANEGKIVVEGINVVSKATKGKTAMAKGGIIKRESPIFASRVMLFCTSCKNPTRVGHKELEGGKKTRVCKKCGESFDA